MQNIHPPCVVRRNTQFIVLVLTSAGLVLERTTIFLYSSTMCGGIPSQSAGKNRVIFLPWNSLRTTSNSFDRSAINKNAPTSSKNKFLIFFIPLVLFHFWK